MARLANSDSLLASLDSISGFATVQSVYFNTRYEGDEFWELNEQSAAKTLRCAEQAMQEVIGAIASYRVQKEKDDTASLNNLKLD